MKLIVKVKYHAGHGPLVGLARPIDIKIAQPDQPGALGGPGARVIIKQQLGIGIHIDRAFIGGRLGKTSARAIHGGAGGIYKGDGMPHGKMQEFLGISVIIIQHILPVLLRGAGTGALVKDKFNVAQVSGAAIARAETGPEFRLVHIIGDAGGSEVGKLFALSEVIDHQNILPAPFVQALDQLTADEAGPARDQDHQLSPSASLILAMVREVDRPGRLARITTLPPFFRTLAAPAICASR